MVGSDAVKCNECGSRDIHRDIKRGETSCGDCGVVMSESEIDPRNEWSSFDGDTSKVRTGMPSSFLFHDKGLSTDIDHLNKDYSGRSLGSRQRIQMHRMRKWQRRSRTSSSFERNMESALVEMSKLAGKMGLSKAVREEAAIMYRRALQKDLVRGRSIENMVAAALYLANQKLKTARSLDDFERHSRVSRKAIARSHKIIKSALKLRIEIAQPEQYIGRYTNLLELPIIVEREAIEIIDRARKRDLTHGKSPTGVAAAAVYIASRLTDTMRTQREIADISGVTEVTIRNRYKELCGNLGIELD